MTQSGTLSADVRGCTRLSRSRATRGEEGSLRATSVDESAQRAISRTVCSWTMLRLLAAPSSGCLISLLGVPDSSGT